MSDPVQTAFLTHFSALRDPRQSAKVLYPLPEILLLLLCATISGADDFVEITLWGEEHMGFLRRFRPYARGIPSHDTLCDVIAAIDPELFKDGFSPPRQRSWRSCAARRLTPTMAASKSAAMPSAMISIGCSPRVAIRENSASLASPPSA